MSPAEDDIDIVDRIAQDLPVEVRAAYYRELNHCRSLPENDEMLRILRAIQFLTLLMREVPERVCIERERLEQFFHQSMETVAELASAPKGIVRCSTTGSPRFQRRSLRAYSRMWLRARSTRAFESSSSNRHYRKRPRQ